MNWFKRLSLGLLALLLLLLAGAAFYGWRALPQTQGSLALPGAKAELQLLRDAYGIPSVVAQSPHDAYFGLGVAHAQDRLWQMESQRRIGAGRLAEVFGESALETDRFLRALGVRRAAQRQWQQLPAVSKAVLQAYADGVNAVLRHGLKARPPEFVILGIEPEPWDPVDSVAWAIMMAWDLGGNWSNELLRLRLSLQMSVDRVNTLMPPYPGEQPLVSTDYAALYRGLGLGASKTAEADQASEVAQAVVDWSRLLDIAPPSGVEGVGSNNWVLAGSRSATGKPLLANDPHLKLSVPALWYLARLQAPGLLVAGATLPGLPIVVLGQNQHVAWGFTNTGPDVQDLYIEAVKTDDPTQYRTPQGYAPFETANEIIKVKGKPDVPIVVRSTRHGPVISDAGTGAEVLGAAPGATQTRYVLALRWTALDADNDATGVGLRMQQATSVESFLAATDGYVAPMQSMVVADTEGRIGLVAPGRLPIRRADNDLKGHVPAPGWDARYDWAGWVPSRETPRETDPARGWIATANQRITAPAYPHYVTSDWALPYRQQRIEQLINAKTRHSLQDLAQMQADVQSLAVPGLLPALLKADAKHPLAAPALALLQGWDGQMQADSPKPLIFWAWQRQIALAVFKDDTGEVLWKRSLATRNFQESLEQVLQNDDSSWCDDRSTPVVETCAGQSATALTRALDELQARYGSDPAQWRWGDAHQARSEHRPFSRVKLLAPLFELRTAVGGDTHTVNVSRVGLKPDATTGELYLDEHGPSLRALYDLGDRTQSRVMHSTGQSGLFFAPQYRSFVKPWAAVQYVPLWGPAGTGDLSAAAGSEARLVIRPGP